MVENRGENTDADVCVAKQPAQNSSELASVPVKGCVGHWDLLLGD